jgi:GT2 family glycosyltransferase
VTDISIVMSPRERFNVQERSLQSLFDHTHGSYELIVVDGGSPPSVERALRALAGRGRLRLLRHDCFLAPNEARNLGVQQASGDYVAFVDNDVIFTDGWLDDLLASAEETGAGIVGPIVCWGEPPHCVVHMAGGDVEFDAGAGGRTLRTHHRLQDADVARARRLSREPTGFAEFHCMLVRRETLAKTGPFDEALKTTREHVDFCLTARNAGAEVWFEPAAVVTYYSPPPLAWSDVPFYVTRWNDAWSMASMRHFMAKWDCSFDAERLRATWIRPHRDVALESVRARLEPWIGWRASTALKRRVEAGLVARARRQRARAGFSATDANEATAEKP